MATTYNPAKKREYYLANRDEIKAKRSRRYYANHDQAKAQQRLWHKLHPQTEEQKEAQRLRRRKHYEANREETIRKTREYHLQNPDVVLRGAVACNQRRRAEKAKAALSDLRVIAQWMKETRRRDYCRCHWCGTKVPGRRIHFDHVTPISKQGPHAISNLCVSCKDCNLRKKARRLVDWIVSGQTFLSL